MQALNVHLMFSETIPRWWILLVNFPIRWQFFFSCFRLPQQDNIDRSSSHRQADLIGPAFQQSAHRSSPNHQGWFSTTNGIYACWCCTLDQNVIFLKLLAILVLTVWQILVMTCTQCASSYSKLAEYSTLVITHRMLWKIIDVTCGVSGCCVCVCVVSVQCGDQIAADYSSLAWGGSEG